MADNIESKNARRAAANRDDNVEVVTAATNETYVEKENENNRVVVFHLDNGIVFYAPEGSGREFKMELNEFLRRFEIVREDPNAGGKDA